MSAVPNGIATHMDSKTAGKFLPERRHMKQHERTAMLHRLKARV